MNDVDVALVSEPSVAVSVNVLATVTLQVNVATPVTTAAAADDETAPVHVRSDAAVPPA